MINLIPFSENLQIEKYRMPNEGFADMCNRHAGALCDNEPHRHAIKDIFVNGRFVLAGRALSSVGNPDPDQTAHNCYLSDIIKDTLTGKGGIYWRLLEAAKTMSMGGGMGFDFSTIRPFDGIASGPVSFMEVFSAMCHNVSRGGKKGRGAMMAMLRVDHPDIQKFITCKRPPTESAIIYRLLEEQPQYAEELHQVLGKLMPLTGFNCSIFTTDEFMEAVDKQSTFKLKFNHGHYGEIDAYELWETIMRNTWEFGDPGIGFGDTANRLDNLWYLKSKLIATNPCAEKWFRRDMSCLLGSFNLTQYVNPLTRVIDFDQLKADMPHIVRAMDNIVDLSNYPLPGQQKAANNDRQLGIGVFGVANALEAAGLVYASPDYLARQDMVLATITHNAYRASTQLAKEKGVFPLYSPEKYPQGKFIQTLPDDIQDGIKNHGIRNSHLISIAPTGSISLSYNNVSPGIEPTFAKRQQRVIKREGVDTITELEDYGVKYFNNNPKTALECTVQEHLAVLLHAQKYVDSAVSKTCNVPITTEWGDFKDIYRDAWLGESKGITTFTTGGKKLGIMKSLDMPSCTLNPETGEKSCD